ncbi:MAG: nitrogen regulation protein NR(II) [Acidobacteriota bacterium]
MRRPKLVRVAIIVGTIAGVSLLHYQTATSHLWLHQLFQRGYYLPLLLAALWFGWRGGLLAATLAGFLYAPHIFLAWRFYPAYSATQYIEIGMFFMVGALTGVLAEQERRHRIKVQETAQKLRGVNAQLQSSFEQLRRADRLSALGELSAGLAHEIRNPLGSVEGAVQILRRQKLPASTRQEFGRLAEEEINRLKGLLSHFLEFARPQTPRFQPTELTVLLESVQLLTAETARLAGARVRIESLDKLPTVSVDPEQMKQVLLNLVINAIQAMAQGGGVVLRSARRADFVAVEVEDEGVGIDPDDLERVFDPFFTTRTGGTGLGLSIAYQIVSQHGGHIEARRNPGRGMTFTVTLPVVQEESPADSGLLPRRV